MSIMGVMSTSGEISESLRLYFMASVSAGGYRADERGCQAYGFAQTSFLSLAQAGFLSLAQTGFFPPTF
jgi:hypothetical protein